MEGKAKRGWSNEARARHMAGVKRWQKELRLQKFAKELAADGTLQKIDAARRRGEIENHGTRI